MTDNLANPPRWSEVPQSPLRIGSTVLIIAMVLGFFGTLAIAGVTAATIVAVAIAAVKVLEVVLRHARR